MQPARGLPCIATEVRNLKHHGRFIDEVRSRSPYVSVGTSGIPLRCSRPYGCPTFGSGNGTSGSPKSRELFGAVAHVPVVRSKMKGYDKTVLCGQIQCYKWA
ncbi:hypothetical protein AB6A40_011686 [Gnathostoma spinigerum]|uniref:Uncharacterized protein n=1 Tax=Gnathostoma spinigerum TaxID=75299 RepID=A0ABD6F4C9_9BILA